MAKIYTLQKGRILCVLFCYGGCQQTQLWASTGVIGGHYLINHKLPTSNLVYRGKSSLQMGHVVTAACCLPSVLGHVC